MRGKYYVYAHITPNGKVYIGITGTKLSERWKDGKGYKGCTLFWKAIEKYGWDNIKHITLIEGVSKEVACECEKALIEKYHANDPQYGYNLTLGGEGALGMKLTEEQSKERSRRMKGRLVSEETRRKIGEANKIALKGRKLSPECIQKISASLKGRSHKPQSPESIRKMAEKQKGNQYHLGHKASEESRRRMSEAHKGQTLPEHVKQMLLDKSREARLDPVKEAQRREKIRRTNTGKKYGPWSEKARAAHMAAIQRKKEREQGVVV